MMKQFIAAAAFGAAIFGTTAHANETAVPQGAIHFADLDLSTEAGVKELDARIDRTSRQICKVHDRVTGSKMVPKDRLDCYKKARNSAKSQMAVHIERARRGG